MAGQLTIDTLKASSGVLATQNGMTGIAKAWVNFAGSTGTRTSSFNVSSVTRTSTGNYTINFATAMADTGYVSVAGTSSAGTSTAGGISIGFDSQTTTSVRMLFYVGTSGYDAGNNYVAIFSS
jgi:hypothetical protein